MNKSASSWCARSERRTGEVPTKRRRSCYQRALLDGLPPEWTALLWPALFAVAAFVIGFAYFERAKDEFEGAL